MKSRSMMFQGTGSNVGKSILVAGLCRVAVNRGYRVAPFKPQNMSNNAAVCQDGGEIGRAQALQAMACRLQPSVDFNPVLLKPQSDRRSQVIVHGQVLGDQDAKQFSGKSRLSLLPSVMESYRRLQEQFDLVLIEGAGSPAETNLRAGDIANMGFARAAKTPVCIIADIDRGGVIASLVGTHRVLEPQDAQQINSFIINKFRGEPSLFDAGLADISRRTGWMSFGVVPWLSEVSKLPQEDAVPLEEDSGVRQATGRKLKVVAPVLSRIANFDDLDPLRQEENVDVEFIAPGKPIPLDTDVVILLGTKSAIADMRFLKSQGWDVDVKALARSGKHILGVCGGLQLLGNWLEDVDGIDGPAGREQGLQLLDIETSMNAGKTVRINQGVHKTSGAPIRGYEIHVGETKGADSKRPFAILESGPDGATSVDGRIAGTYLHGLFSSDDFRRQWLASIKPGFVSELDYDANVDSALEQLSQSIEKCLDVDRVLDAAR